MQYKSFSMMIKDILTNNLKWTEMLDAIVLTVRLLYGSFVALLSATCLSAISFMRIK